MRDEVCKAVTKTAIMRKKREPKLAPFFKTDVKNKVQNNF